MDPVWVVIAPGFPPASLGGAEIHADGVARALEARGVRVERVEARRSPPPERLPWKHAVVHLHLASDTLTPWVEALRGRYPMLLTLHDVYLACPQLFYARAVNRACSARDARHCPVCMHRRAWTARLGYLFRRWGWEPTGAMRRWKAYRRALALLPPRGVRWIFPSRFVARHARALLSDAPGVVLPNFPVVPLSRKAPPAPRVWGWMGNLSPGKGVDLLLEAWARCGTRVDPRAELHLWGEPASGQATWWQALWRRYRRTPGVFWHGAYAPTETSDVLQRVDAVVLPSRAAENCPLTVVDALAMGRWVLASDRGGLPDLLPEAYRFAPEVEGLCEAWARVRRLPPPPWPAQVPSETQYVNRLLALAEEVMREHG